MAKRSGRNRICAQPPISSDEDSTEVIDQKN